MKFHNIDKDKRINSNRITSSARAPPHPNVQGSKPDSLAFASIHFCGNQEYFWGKLRRNIHLKYKE